MVRKHERRLLRKVVCGALAAAMLAGPGAIHAQQGIGSGCPGGAEPVGEIGINSFECTNCVMWTEREDGKRSWSFSSEPIVRSVRDGSPADGKVESGDRIVAIDGHLITTAEGGRRLANLEPDQAVSLVVRAGSRERTVELVARAECPQSPAAAPAVAATPMPARPPAADALPAPAAAGVLARLAPVPEWTSLPSGWFGFGIRCTDCKWTVDEEDGTSEWEFSTHPEVSSVQNDSPADAAGLERGDVLLEIDGESLLTAEGGRQFGSVEPGQTVRWTYRRDGRVQTTTATAGERPDPVPAVAPAPPRAGVAQTYRLRPEVNTLRYSGSVGGTSVEVRGANSVVVHVIEPGREIEIVSADSRTRVRLDEPD